MIQTKLICDDGFGIDHAINEFIEDMTINNPPFKLIDIKFVVNEWCKTLVSKALIIYDCETEREKKMRLEIACAYLKTL